MIFSSSKLSQRLAFGSVVVVVVFYFSSMSSEETLGSGSASHIEPVDELSPPPKIVADIWHRGFVLENPYICRNVSEDIDVLVMVNSAQDNIASRNLIRTTWGGFASQCAVRSVNESGVRKSAVVLFFIGSSPSYNAGVEKLLREERDQYKDIVVARTKDSYKMLTLKSLSMLDWAVRNCPKARYVMKIDDDTFLNYANLLDYLNKDDVRQNVKSVFGHPMLHLKPNRNPKHKWFVPYHEIPVDWLPPFVAGPAYVLTRDSLQPLINAAFNSTFVRNEDVFITGIVANKAQVRRIICKKFVHWPNKKQHVGSPSFRNVITYHLPGRKDKQKLKDSWSDIVQPMLLANKACL